jgi:predicted RNA polymerase sigma factor
LSLGARETAEAVARAAYGRLVAYLSARSRDVAAVEDALGEAFAAASGSGRSVACRSARKPGCSLSRAAS